MESQNHPPSDNPSADQNRAQIASTYPVSPPQKGVPANKKQTSAQPVAGDLTSRLVSVFLWLSFGTTAGCIGQMAVTRRPPNIGAGMAIGLTAALVCAYKDLEGTQMPQQLLRHPQKFFNRFEARLDGHSVQLVENTAGQERLERKLDLLSNRVDTLTLATVRPSSEPMPQALPSISLVPPANDAPVNSTHVNGSGQTQNSLGAGF